MQVPHKYVDLKNRGKDCYYLADVLVRDGYGKLQVVIVLRHLFELSLGEADAVYEQICANNSSKAKSKSQ